MTHSTITTAQLTINRTGSGQYSFQVDTPDGQFSMRSTNSVLVDAINSDDDENDWGTRQDAIDRAIESVLEHNNIDLSND